MLRLNNAELSRCDELPLTNDVGVVIWSLDERRGAARVTNTLHLWKEWRHVVLAVVDVGHVES
jgi:hypothetical protein